MTSLFGGGSNIVVNAAGTLVPQQLIPTDGQTVFTLTAFQYIINTNSLLVFINGSLQVPLIDYTETSSTTFTLLSPVLSTDSIRVIGFPLATFFQAGVGNLLTDIPTVAIVQNNLYSWMGTVAGTNNYTGVVIPVPLAPTAGMVFRFIVGVSNTGASTLNGVAIRKISAAGIVALVAGDLVAGAAYQVVFDGTFYQLSGGSGSGGATGGGTDAVFYLNKTAMTTSYTVPVGSNAHTVGPLTIATGAALTVSTGQRLVVL